jgi:imidazole glycerol phosphate synthase glutamine amidotransferase subunit
VTEVAVVDYGAGNTRSVRAALSRLGLTTRVTSDPDALEGADLVVLPGVGSARSAMDHLTRSGGADALRRRFDAGGSILGICLGLQLAVDFSDEDGGVAGLGLVPGRVRRLDAPRVPRIGWATVEPWGQTYFFAHSYAVTSPDVVATSEGVAAAVSKGAFMGVQFHPEKSGPAGLAYLESCLSRV